MKTKEKQGKMPVEKMKKWSYNICRSKKVKVKKIKIYKG